MKRVFKDKLVEPKALGWGDKDWGAHGKQRGTGQPPNGAAAFSPSGWLPRGMAGLGWAIFYIL